MRFKLDLNLYPKLDPNLYPNLLFKLYFNLYLNLDPILYLDLYFKLDPNLHPNLLPKLYPNLPPKLPLVSSKLTELATKPQIDSIPKKEEKLFNISIINIAIYDYHLRNYKKEGIILFYIMYESLSEAADNFLKDYIEIIKIIIIYNDFINKAVILNEITN